MEMKGGGEGRVLAEGGPKGGERLALEAITIGGVRAPWHARF